MRGDKLRVIDSACYSIGRSDAAVIRVDCRATAMIDRALTLDLLPGELAVCRLEPGETVPSWAWIGAVVSVTRTTGELSVVCDAAAVPGDVTHTAGWRALRVRGPLDFDLVGILAGLSRTLAEAEVPIFAISTHDTDLVLVRQGQLERALRALDGAGHSIGNQDSSGVGTGGGGHAGSGG